MFAFFKAREAQRTRRHARLWRQSAWRFTLATAALAVVCGGAYLLLDRDLHARIGAEAQRDWEQATVALGFQVNDILVMGRHEIGAAELLQHLGIEKGAPIFSVDLEGAQALLHQINWVDRVTVSRRLPDTIIVTLQERQPVALWQYQKKISLIDKTGFVIKDHDLDAYASLPLVVGEDAPMHVGELAQLMQAEPALAGDLASALRVGRRRWDLRLKNGVIIRLPENNVELALSRLVAASRDEGLLDKDVTVIDLRLPEKLTLTPNPAAAADTAAADSKKKNI